tara:strand:+ start:194 stop:361 length:168 start_codon:yes stop_codon:yes gene_type:complete
MSKIDIVIPQPSEEYEASNQQQQLQALDQLKNQLNTTFLNDLKEEQERFIFFIYG